MKTVKRTIMVLAVVLMLISGAVTVCAVSEDAGKTSDTPAVAEEYAAEEMAVGAYYEFEI